MLGSRRKKKEKGNTGAVQADLQDGSGPMKIAPELKAEREGGGNIIKG